MLTDFFSVKEQNSMLTEGPPQKRAKFGDPGHRFDVSSGAEEKERKDFLATFVEASLNDRMRSRPRKTDTPLDSKTARDTQEGMSWKTMPRLNGSESSNEDASSPATGWVNLQQGTRPRLEKATILGSAIVEMGEREMGAAKGQSKGILGQSAAGSTIGSPGRIAQKRSDGASVLRQGGLPQGPQADASPRSRVQEMAVLKQISTEEKTGRILKQKAEPFTALKETGGTRPGFEENGPRDGARALPRAKETPVKPDVRVREVDVSKEATSGEKTGRILKQKAEPFTALKQGDGFHFGTEKEPSVRVAKAVSGEKGSHADAISMEKQPAALKPSARAKTIIFDSKLNLSGLRQPDTGSTRTSDAGAGGSFENRGEPKRAHSHSVSSFSRNQEPIGLEIPADPAKKGRKETVSSETKKIPVGRVTPLRPSNRYSKKASPVVSIKGPGNVRYERQASRSISTQSEEKVASFKSASGDQPTDTRQKATDQTQPIGKSDARPSGFVKDPGFDGNAQKVDMNRGEGSHWMPNHMPPSNSIERTVSQFKGMETIHQTFREEGFRQLVEKAAMNLRDGRQEFKIELKPDLLGQVKLHVSTEHHQVTIRILTELPVAKEMLENNIHQLRVELQGHGVEIDKLEVVLSQDLARNDMSQDPYESRRPKKGGRQKRHTKTAATSSHAEEEPRAVDDRSDRAINLFA